MKNSAQLTREYRDMLRKEGALVVACQRAGSGHFKTILRAPDGREGLYVFSHTPGDGRTILNDRAAVRRFMQGRDRAYSQAHCCGKVNSHH
jgi:hypothetical protein